MKEEKESRVKSEPDVPKVPMDDVFQPVKSETSVVNDKMDMAIPKIKSELHDSLTTPINEEISSHRSGIAPTKFNAPAIKAESAEDFCIPSHLVTVCGEQLPSLTDGQPLENSDPFASRLRGPERTALSGVFQMDEMTLNNRSKHAEAVESYPTMHGLRNVSGENIKQEITVKMEDD